ASPVPLAVEDGNGTLLERAAPVDHTGNTDFLTKTGVNCMIAKDADCWEVLKMDDYVKGWLAGPKGQICGTQGIAEGFGDCYIDLYRMGDRCSLVTVSACAADITTVADDLAISDLADSAGKPISELEKRQVFVCATAIRGMSRVTSCHAMEAFVKKYANECITAMNVFFYSWYTASNTAAKNTVDQITNIVQVASPPPDTPKNVWKSLAVDALLAGLAFVPGLSSAQTAISSTARKLKSLEAPARIILTASAAVYGDVFPNDGSAASDLIDMATLTTDLGNFVTDLQARLVPALARAVNDPTEFLKVANTGAFSSENPPSLPEQTTGLERALATYVISVALNYAGWYGVVAPQTDVNALLGGQYGKPNLEYGCTAVDPVTRQCNAIWQDVPNNQGFTMVQSSNFLNNPYEKFQKYFGNTEHYPYTTPGEYKCQEFIHNAIMLMPSPELLLVGAARCRQRPNWGTVGISFENGDINLDCLSQLKICTYRTDCAQYTDANDRGHYECKYIESDCTTEDGYGRDNNRYHGMPDMEAEAGDGFFVEPGYMGPFRTGELDHPLHWKNVGT
ncbi:MAG: hypothetical protein LQ346_008975, partial [Caloplaca aetnensis]